MYKQFLKSSWLRNPVPAFKLNISQLSILCVFFLTACFGDAKNEPKTEPPLLDSPSTEVVIAGQVEQKAPLTINGIPLTSETILAKRKEWKQRLKSLNVSAGEDSAISNFSHTQFVTMPSYDHMGQNTVIKSSDLFEIYMNNVQEQLDPTEAQTSDSVGLKKLFDFLHDLGRTYTGLRLDKSGTTVKVVHYGPDEYPKVRTRDEKRVEPAIFGAFLQFSLEEKVEFLRLASYIKTVEKIGISDDASPEAINQKLKSYQNIGAQFNYSDMPQDINFLLQEKESELSKKEKILVTHNGISLALSTEEPAPISISADVRFLTDKYNINNFDVIRDSQSLSEENRHEVSEFFSTVLNSDGRILMSGYAIAGFGDLVNFQMLYKTIIKKHPELKDRIDAYAHFYRYSISNDTLDKLLDKDIKVITHQNANRQWDPNYSYQLVRELGKRHNPQFEIQYNVGSVYSVVDRPNVLRVGEIGGMAGVSQVKDAYFTGLSRGAIGFGIPCANTDIDSPNVKSTLVEIIRKVLGHEPDSHAPLSTLIQDHFALMMARENSQVINQGRFYNVNDVQDGQNLSIGKRVLAEILKAMAEHPVSGSTIVLATGRIDALQEQAQAVGVSLEQQSSFSVQGSRYKLFELTTESGNKAFVVQGFFDNALVNAVMKDASIPTVYSGEGSMNEGLSFRGKGFMIPFYDYQVTTLIESAGIFEKKDAAAFEIEVDGNDEGFQDDPNKLVKIKPETDALLINSEVYDLVKLTLDNRSPQMYMVTKKSASEVHLKKLDKTDLDFQVLSSGTSLQHVSNTYHAEATVYKLEVWAQEWLKLIYDRESSQLNLDKLGEQTASMLREETIQRANWFDLFDQFID
ncbi:hypothetical protein MHN79_07070 [Vibrio sp. Of14-4]|uniref:hypothetical protein n=1 Tax=Vibrio sp. Of14-4 TaxID=2724878 RepID=UPI001EF1C3DA|nr:hypothetical protein [Vibrio sp. Of14-4]MCG7489247.1 hypothetical protein [Vibrio sp. Of14-4]